VKSRYSVSRRDLVIAGLAGAAAAAVGPRPGATAASIGKLEKPSIKLGLAVPATSYLPIYVAAEKTWAAEGLDVQIVTFRGDAEAAQALAGGSVDVTVQSIDGLINLIDADQSVVGFYAGFNQADFAWAAGPSVKSWKDVKGGMIGISTFGSLTEHLTRYVVRKNGLDPEKDVKIMQSGPAPGRFQALKGGRLGATILSLPFTRMAEEEGLTMLGTQARDVAPEWPKHEFLAKIAFLNDNPNTVKALLRAHVAAIRAARADRPMAVDVFTKQLKYTKPYAEVAYDEAIGGFDESGKLPEKFMGVFWEIMVEGGVVKEPWPNTKILDDRFIKSFATWAP
jgi:NitT/TauT family transport system substrate-binding protein